MKKIKEILLWISGIILTNKGNWKAILLCIITATTFWLFRSLNKDYTTRINYPVVFDFEQDSVVVVKELPSKVRIDVSSGGWNLLRSAYWFNIKPVSIQLDKPVETRYIPRATLLPIFSDQLNVLRINYVVTDTLFINIEEKTSKKVKMLVDSINISLSKPYRIVSSLSVTPDSLEFQGPRSQISQLPDTFVLRLTERNIDENFNETVEVIYEPSALVKVIPSEVHLKFDIEPYIRSSRKVALVPIGFPQDSSFYLKNRRVTLFFTIRENLTQNLNDTLYQITADFSNINYSDSTLIPRLIKYPEFAEDYFIKPIQVKVINAP
ncbi:MAG: hypothetical protein O6848_03050 [Bacteroidetes bacterium]|nr:hypothetical protein [Bacteroidota bacterium]